jgi:hypothetical protein
MEAQPTNYVEVVRSFSYKLSESECHLIPKFASRDFFCSQKAQCRAAEAEAVSDAVYQFCKRQVMKAVREYIQELEAQAKTDRDYVNERKAELDRTRLASVKGGR